MLGARRLSLMTCTFCIAIASALLAQHSKVEATWLHRYVPVLNERKHDLSSTTCHYRPIFDAGGSENTLQTVTRFAEVRSMAAVIARPFIMTMKKKSTSF